MAWVALASAVLMVSRHKQGDIMENSDVDDVALIIAGYIVDCVEREAGPNGFVRARSTDRPLRLERRDGTDRNHGRYYIGGLSGYVFISIERVKLPTEFVPEL